MKKKTPAELRNKMALFRFGNGSCSDLKRVKNPLRNLDTRRRSLQKGNSSIENLAGTSMCVHIDISTAL